MQPGVRTSKISKSLPQARQTLAQALCDLYDCIPAQDGKQLSHARFINRMKAGHVEGSSFSRYLSGKTVPPPRFIKAFYALTSSYVSGPLPLSCEELIILHKQATATDKRLREVRNSEFERKVLERTASNAEPSILPVPQEAGDRQGNVFLERPAPQAAAEVIELTAVGLHEQALTLLSRLSEHHDAAEVAQCVAHFRIEGHDELADTLIQIYGRDHQGSQHRDVIRMSIALRDLQLPDDADSLLNLLV